MRGAETQQILASVVQTAHQRDLDLTDTLTTRLRTQAVLSLDVFERRSL
jgi:hypothetical protein